MCITFLKLEHCSSLFSSVHSTSLHSLANIADSTFLAQLHWSSNIYNMMPFVASMVILAFTSKNSMAP